MSVFVLKILAVITMVMDHTGYILNLALQQNGPLILLMRSVGRFALPVFAFLIVNGLEKSSDRRGYLARLSAFALISQIPFTLAFTAENYMSPRPWASATELSILHDSPISLLLIAAALLICFFTVSKGKPDRFFIIAISFLCAPLFGLKLGGICVLGESLNVFYTLSISLAVLCVLDGFIRNRKGSSPSEYLLTLMGTAAAALFILPLSDYGYKGLFLIIALYFAGASTLLRCAVIILWSWWMYGYYSPFFFCAAAACLPIVFYRGKKGPSFKLGFYYIYPIHLLLLFFFGMFTQ